MIEIDRQNIEVAAEQLWSVLEPKIQYLPAKDRKVVELAFTMMVMAHDTDRRKSGEFYIMHPVAACLTLAEIRMDKSTLAACLLHDVPEDTKITLSEIGREFGSEIAFLVEGVTKLSSIKYQGEDRYAENLRRMFIAMSKDLRVIFIKLADRLHNLRTLKHVKPEKQRRIALESMQIYAPIAERLGMGYFRGEIEDAAFKYIYPEDYYKLVNDSDLVIDKRQHQLQVIRKKTEGLLKKEQIPYEQISGRAKKYFSIFKKLKEKGREIDDLYDLVALRLVTDKVENCYQILSLLHQEFTPLNNRVKDYIARPKLNGYQSIHTTVKDEQTGVIFEFQIRTREMHEFAEFGVAAHWAYKEQKNQKSAKEKEDLQNIVSPETFKWLSELIQLGQEQWTEEEYLKHVKLDLFQDRIFVMTPKNDAIDLPKGATALDFAYKIHEQVGHRASMAKVNGEIVRLSDKLKNGDVVEIIRDKRQSPKSHWVDWVITTQANKQIKLFLRKQAKE